MRVLVLLFCCVAAPAQTVQRSVFTAAGGAIAVAPDGAVVVAGHTDSASVLATASPLSEGGGRDIFVQRYSADLTQLLTSVRLGGPGSDAVTAMTLDSQGNIYLAGSTEGGFPTTEGSFLPAPSGLPSRYVAKLNPAANAVLWGTYFPSVTIRDLAVDPQDRLNITGDVSIPFVTTTDAVQPTPRLTLCNHTPIGTLPCPDAFLTRLNATDGSLLYSTYFGGSMGDGTDGSGSEIGQKVRVTPDGRVFVGGFTSSIDFPVTHGEIQKRSVSDAFVFGLQSNGREVAYSRLLGESGPGSTKDLAVDSEGAVTILGSGSEDHFVAKLAPDGSALRYFREIGNSSQLLVRDGSTWIAGSAYASGPKMRYCFGTTYFSNLNHETGEVTPLGYTSRLGSLVARGPNNTAYLGGLARRLLPGAAANAPSLSFGPTGDIGFRIALVTLGANPPGFVACIVNAASFEINSGDVPGQSPGVPVVSPGEIVTMTGMGLGPEAGVAATVTGDRLPTLLAGVRVLFDDVPAPLLYVQDGQINAIAPFSIATETIRVAIERDGVALPSVDMFARSTAPGIFTATQDGQGQILAANETGGLNSPANPAVSGSYVTFYATGLGQTNPPLRDGMITPLDGASPLLTNIEVRIGVEKAEVLYAGPAPGLVAGAYQLNVRVPSVSNAGNYDLAILANGVETRNLGKLAVRPR